MGQFVILMCAFKMFGAVVCGPPVLGEVFSSPMSVLVTSPNRSLYTDTVALEGTEKVGK